MHPHPISRQGRGPCWARPAFGQIPAGQGGDAASQLLGGRRRHRSGYRTQGATSWASALSRAPYPQSGHLRRYSEVAFSGHVASTVHVPNCHLGQRP